MPLALHALNSPGKRLRPALTLLSGKLIDYRFEKLLPLSVAFEMVHLATLVHDDIIDDADTRRGLPTVNARYGNSCRHSTRRLSLRQDGGPHRRCRGLPHRPALLRDRGPRLRRHDHRTALDAHR